MRWTNRGNHDAGLLRKALGVDRHGVDASRLPEAGVRADAGVASHRNGRRARDPHHKTGCDSAREPSYESLGFREDQPLERWGCDIDSMDEYELDAPPIVESGGYLLHRPGMLAHYLGPCVADNPITAERLFRRAMEEIGADHYFWDLLPANAHAVDLARSLNFAPLRKLKRMVLGPNPPEDQSRIYAIAGFEWG